MLDQEIDTFLCLRYETGMKWNQTVIRQTADGYQTASKQSLEVIRRSSYDQQNKTLFSPVSTRMYALLNTGIGDEMNNGSFYFFAYRL